MPVGVSPVLVMMLAITVVALLALMMSQSPASRVVAVVGFALVGLKGSEGIDPLETLWFAVAAIAVATSVIDMTLRRRHIAPVWGRPLGLSVAWAVFVIFALIVGLQGGGLLSGALSSAITPIALSAAVWIGVSSGPRTNPTLLRTLTVIAGLVSAYSFGVFWSSTRSGTGFSQNTLEAAFLPSLTLTMLAITLLLSMLVNAPSHTKHRTLITVGAPLLVGVMAVLLLSSGNRTVVLGLVGALSTLLFAAKGASFARSLRSAVLALLGAAIVIALLSPVVIAAFRISPAALVRRFSSFSLLAESGVAADASGLSRLQIYADHITAIQQYPILGLGLGAAPQSGLELAIDSPLLVIVRFGLIGAALLVWFLVAFFRVTTRTDPLNSESVIWTAAIKGWLVAQLFVLPVQYHLEDKGLPLVLLITAAAAARFHNPPADAERPLSPRTRARALGQGVPRGH